MMIIVKGQPDDLAELQQLFAATIDSICRADYNDDQIKVWASGVQDNRRWQDIMTRQLVLVAQEEGKVKGFCTLDKGSHIDLLYVHKDYQRQGIAHKLYADMEQEARQQGSKEITSDVSKTARPFFESMGFEVVMEQIVVRDGIELTNFKMKKLLGNQ